MKRQTDIRSLIEAYQLFFAGSTPQYRIFSPYRICPIGAHVDHQHGLVSGFAFNSGIDFLFSPTETGKVEMCSLSFEGLMTFNVRREVDKPQRNWGDYLRGAVWAMQQDFALRTGIRGVVRGSMPIGGLSSSAALLVGCVKALAMVNNLTLSDLDVIHYASEAERNYVGLKNGILDQACVVLCKKNQLLFLDTADSSYELIPFGNDVHRQPPFKIGIFFSGVTRNLKGTDYNLRVAECKTAAWMMQGYEDVQLKELKDTFLRDVPAEYLSKHQDKMPERFAKRARHFYSECDRVRRGVEAWRKGDIKAFGQCMFESCESSEKQYECGSDELRALDDILRQTDGVYGGRFSGAGFKGAYIALIDPDKTEEVSEKVKTEYLNRFPQYKNKYEDYFCDTCNGAEFLNIDDAQ